MNEKLLSSLGNFGHRYPHCLAEKYPRIIERIVDLWESPKSTIAYLNELMIDQRGGRQGFPPDVAREIFMLSVIYEGTRGKQGERVPVWGREQLEAQKKLEKKRLKFVPAQMLEAAEADDPSLVQLFLEAGMEVDCRDDRDWTPLFVAAFNGREAIVKVLVEHGANVKARDRSGFTPLHWAIRWTPGSQGATQGHAAVIALLLEAGADPNAASGDGLTALHKAVSIGHAETVATLLKAGASVSVQTRDGATPRSTAEKGKHLRVIELLRNGV